MANPTLFKVLTAEGLPANGNARTTGFRYELPDGEPSAWTKPAVGVKACESGYHLTTRPGAHWVAGARLFTAEGQGQMDFQGDKVACESIRLVEEVTPEWAWLPLFPEARALLFSTWRMANPEGDPPAWADLGGAYLRGADLRGATDVSLPDGWEIDEDGYVRPAQQPEAAASVEVADGC